MNTTSSPQQPVPLSSDGILVSLPSPPVFPLATPSLLTPSLITRSTIVDHRLKPRTAGVDIDTNKLSTTIKRSQAISNIQDLDENSPVTFEIEPNEHLHLRKKVQLQTNSISISNRTINESISSIDQQQTNSSGCGDESDARSESSEKPPEYLEEEKPILTGIHVKGATLNRLIRVLIDSFQSNGTVIDDSEYPKVFFLMHKWIMESEYLSNMLYDLYRHSSDDYKKAMNANDKRFSKDYQLRICHAYNYWMKNFPMHFDLDRNLKETCAKIKNLIESSGDTEYMKLVDLSQIPSFDWMRQMTVRNQMKNKTVSLGFNNIEPQTLAAQLTYLEWKILRRITFTDYKAYAIKNTLQDNPRLERSIQFFNGLSTWIQCMVLSKMTPKQRAEIIHKFLDVAKYLRELQNFNTCLAVIGGISHSALARLSKTMMCLSPEDIKLLTEMTDLLSSNSNYAQYRKNLSECEGFKIPIIGVHLKDIISLHVALQDRLEYDLINFRKLVQLSITFRTLNNLQESVPPVQPNHDLINLLTLSLDLSYTEDEIYELSLAREPRSSVSSVSSPDQTSRALHPGETTSDSMSDTYKKKEQVQSPVFADWAAGVSQTIDLQTIQRHVNAMVEAVFTTYDHDRDGYISHTEFEEIAQNFPFIDTFTVLDADQDGMISKTEMRSYFLRAKYHDLKGEFKHDFHETTYFKPTFCVHCTGLLWGLIKQGWKCKDCGINAHRHCKDQVVMECRQKRQHPVNKQGSVSDSRPSRSSFRIRKTRKQKATQTEDINFSSSTSSQGTSESCTSSSDEEHHTINNDKSTHHQQWHLRKPSSLKHRKTNFSDSNEEYYYTHPPSPLPQQQQQQQQQIAINNNIPGNVIPMAQQLIPRGPLICSDSFEKWNDRSFGWNRSLPQSTLLSSAPSTSTGTSESTTSITTTTTTERETHEQDKSKSRSFYDQTPFLEHNVSDDYEDNNGNHFIESKQNDTPPSKHRSIKTTICKDVDLLTSSAFDDNGADACVTNLQTIQSKINFGSSENLNTRKLSLTESLHSLPAKPDPTQNEIFERLRQAEEEKKRLEVENRAMKQELVRTKSKISSLRREMTSIQQLHLAQQQQQHVQGLLSAPTILLNRQKLEQHHHHSSCQPQPHPQSLIFTYKTENCDPTNSCHDYHKKNLSISSNEEPVSPPPTTNHPTCSVQSTQTTSRSPPSTILNFSNLLLSSPLNNTSNDQQSQIQSRRSFSLTPSSIHCDSTISVSDEQLRLYLTETLQREKDSAV
ncbi:unnamed protein product [Rotaria socialis]|uniref:Uncharacterized protein n=1 Tax=Rotaria socialis TaxID=392032 RepID=A0A819A260_9BILA|nr:unnamed protein product [Rotaria socialis]CAF4532142.1 unnamed protein product [Rotaria socialis]